MPTYRTIADAKAANERHPCSVDDCTNPRIGVSKYCMKHRNHFTLYGHPLQTKLHSSRHAVERQQVTEIFNSNSNHPGILSAIRWIQQWMDDAITGRAGTVLAAEDLRRLHDNGVTARDIVIEAASFYIFQQWNKHKFLNDAAVDVAMSLAILSLAPLDKRSRAGTPGMVPVRIRAKPRKAVGRWIRSHLIDLFVNLQNTIESNRNAAFTTQEAMRSPLTFPPALVPMGNKQ